MEYEINSLGQDIILNSSDMDCDANVCGYSVIFDSVTIDTTIGGETTIKVEQAINYIKSGEQEIKNYVENVSKPELVNHVETVNKAEISRYISEEKQPEIDEYIDNYINTESKPELNSYLQNDIKPALQVFANEKTLEFDNNAQAKQALVDASAQAAANSEAISIEKANSAQQSASEAKISETKAMASETNAKASENSCKDILERLGTVIKIKGRVNSESDLPTSGNLNGDVYLVGAEGLESYPEYYWFDDHWEFIGISSDKLEWGTLQGTLSNQTDLQQALDSKVSLTSNQTVGGIKTFTGTAPIKLSRNGYSYSEVMTTSDGTTRTGGFRNISDNHNTTLMYVTSDDGTQIKGNIGIVFDGTSAYTQAPTPATNDSSTKIATTANVDAKITAQAVKLTDNQTVAGVKTFTNQPIVLTSGGDCRFWTKTSAYAQGTAPAHDIYGGYRFLDTNGIEIATCFGKVSTNNVSSCQLCVKSPVTGSTTAASIGINCDANGNFYTNAPTPATADNSTKIATTAFVNNILSTLYPVGSVYIGTQSTCPLADLIGGSTWTLIAGDKVLQGSSSSHSAGSTIAAGLPNITGQCAITTPINQELNGSGALRSETTGSENISGTSYKRKGYVKIDASLSNSIYGKSTTVQPPAYVVNIWKRTA